MPKHAAIKMKQTATASRCKEYRGKGSLGAKWAALRRGVDRLLGRAS